MTNDTNTSDPNISMLKGLPVDSLFFLIPSVSYKLQPPLGKEIPVQSNCSLKSVSYCNHFLVTPLADQATADFVLDFGQLSIN